MSGLLVLSISFSIRLPPSIKHSDLLVSDGLTSLGRLVAVIHATPGEPAQRELRVLRPSAVHKAGRTLDRADGTRAWSCASESIHLPLQLSGSQQSSKGTAIGPPYSPARLHIPDELTRSGTSAFSARTVPAPAPVGP